MYKPTAYEDSKHIQLTTLKMFWFFSLSCDTFIWKPCSSHLPLKFTCEEMENNLNHFQMFVESELGSKPSKLLLSWLENTFGLIQCQNIQYQLISTLDHWALLVYSEPKFKVKWSKKIITLTRRSQQNKYFGKGKARNKCSLFLLVQ